MRVLVTAGPTVESIDPVRFISNRSSGKMGYAIAAEAVKAGNEVVLISGPVSISPPKNVEFIGVESAAEMAEAVFREATTCDIIVMVAAVADYRPVSMLKRKMKKSAASCCIELERTEDILATLGRHKRESQILVGFAAETENLIDNALAKMRAKNLDWIIANPVGEPDRGFASDTNRVIMLSQSGESFDIPLQDKRAIAHEIISRIMTR